MKPYLTTLNLDKALTAIAFVWAAYLGWQLVDVLLFTAAVWLVLRPLAAPQFGKLAMLAAVLTAAFYVLHRNAWAGQLATVAYYLCIAAFVSACLGSLRGSAGEGRE